MPRRIPSLNAMSRIRVKANPCSQLCLMKQPRLHALQNLLLELTLHLLARLVGVGLAVEVEEGTKVELGLLEDLDLADMDL